MEKFYSEDKIEVGIDEVVEDVLQDLYLLEQLFS